MARYKIILADFQSNERVEELPFYSVSYGESLNGLGTIDFTMPLRNSKINRENLIPWRSSIYVVKDNAIKVGGIVTVINPDTSNGTLQVQCQGLLAYLNKRTLNRTNQFEYPDTDQTSDITQYLMDQFELDYSVGWTYDITASGVLREQTTYYSFEHREFLFLLNQLVDFEDGFDFSMKSSFSGDDIIDVFKTHYPRRGIRKNLHWRKFPAGQPGSNIDVVSAPFDGLNQANSINQLGNGEGYGMLTATATNVNLVGPSKFPLLQATLSDKSRDIQSEVNDRAVENLRLMQREQVTASLVLRNGHDDTEVDAFDIGDEVKLEASDGWLELTGFWRIVGYNVAVSEGEVEAKSADVVKVYS